MPSKFPSCLGWCNLMIFPPFDMVVNGGDWCSVPRMSGSVFSKSQVDATEVEQIILANGHIQLAAFKLLTYYEKLHRKW